MKEYYTDIVEEISSILCDTVLKREESLVETIKDFDLDANKILRQVGLRLMSKLFKHLSKEVTQQAKTKSLVIHRIKKIKYAVLFGELEVESPYLWNKKASSGFCPVPESLGIQHGGRSKAVKRALTDFGSEESFGQASKRFAEHYGWDVQRASVRREVETIAYTANKYVEKRLKSPPFQSTEQQDTVYRLLVELDGSHVRTGVIEPKQSGELTKKRKLKPYKRQIDWREVRVGLAGKMNNKDDRTYVACMSKYPEVVEQLYYAALIQGLMDKTQVYAVADGGNGLREALEQRFPSLQFILDRSHLKQHIYGAADTLSQRLFSHHYWAHHVLGLIDRGKVKKAISFIKTSFPMSNKEQVLQNLCNYLERFSDATYYDLFRRQELPIGSGEIESAHRYIPQKRLKLPGATWHPQTINPMLALRIIRVNNWWDDFWQTASF